MKKTLLFIVLSMVLTNTSLAQEPEPTLAKASDEHVASLINMCKSYAQEDEVSPQDLPKYLLVCVNDELASDDYQTLKTLPLAMMKKTDPSGL